MKKILIYGVGKSGSLIAFLLVKEKRYDISLYDEDEAKAKRLAVDLGTIALGKGKIRAISHLNNHFDLIIVSASGITKRSIVGILNLNALDIYIYSNVDDETFAVLKQDKRVAFCGASVNRAREFWLNNSQTLQGSHWREEPAEIRERIKTFYEHYIKPSNYGAVYYAVKEIRKLLFKKSYIKEGSFDVVLPREVKK